MMDLPIKNAPTPFQRIDETLEAQEKSVTNMYDEYGYAMLAIALLYRGRESVVSDGLSQAD